MSSAALAARRDGQPGPGRVGNFVNASMNVSETEKEIRITAELPGVTEQDIDVSLDDDVLTIRGEKKFERTDDKENFHFVERSYGTFQRSLRLPFPVDPEQVQASFENGVLTVTVPKTGQQERSRRIQVQGPGGGQVGGGGGGGGGRGGGGRGQGGARGGPPGGAGSASRGGRGRGAPRRGRGGEPRTGGAPPPEGGRRPGPGPKPPGPARRSPRGLKVVSLVLTGLIGLVIAAAVIHLSFRILMLVLSGLLDPAETGVFQAVFGMIFTVLIALEFNHSIIGVLHRKESIVQVRTVVLIALLALVRKFIILDASKTDPLTILGLAAAILALGSVHWLVRDQDRKDAAEQDQAQGTAD